MYLEVESNSIQILFCLPREEKFPPVIKFSWDFPFSERRPSTPPLFVLNWIYHYPPFGASLNFLFFSLLLLCVLPIGVTDSQPPPLP
ncbi:uncharacterized protein BO72DRAFT_244424 [Aspergillus fijiensis CBS 313.89]|uniref:Uncharacterized protein n=1 Tax=Aspergillus fijiensis CBS 313.89 TaxID=1448319 RepID=A0A8G1RJ96_9EURO|nr:uncharacterized protein BO72DRAFT_244424 [Aspergillus fijiensis CBS 313.89]RAK73437.1 hypothetical protein BO72DRAFT_244424 [Aspergillus fijiensis CBS 313.89]